MQHALLSCKNVIKQEVKLEGGKSDWSKFSWAAVIRIEWNKERINVTGQICGKVATIVENCKSAQNFQKEEGICVNSCARNFLEGLEDVCTEESGAVTALIIHGVCLANTAVATIHQRFLGIMLGKFWAGENSTHLQIVHTSQLVEDQGKLSVFRAAFEMQKASMMPSKRNPGVVFTTEKRGVEGRKTQAVAHGFTVAARPRIQRLVVIIGWHFRNFLSYRTDKDVQIWKFGPISMAGFDTATMVKF